MADAIGKCTCGYQWQGDEPDADRERHMREAHGHGQVWVKEEDLRIDVYSTALPWPLTKRGMRVTHLPTGLVASREFGAERSMLQARLECIEEILDKMKEQQADGD